jgi:hypothetical protein
VEILLRAGWKPSSNENEMFEEGLWVLREAVMEYAGAEVVLRVFYRADQDALYLSMDMPDESSVELKMDVDRRVVDLLGVVTSFQDEVTQMNYKEHIRSLINICDNIYVLGEGEKFVRLTDNKRA